MKAKFIYEAFREDSDPIDDMGIGIRHMYDSLKDDDILIMINPMDMYYSSMKQTVIFPKGTIVHIHQIVNKEENRKQMVCTQYENTSDFINDIAVEEIDGSNKRNRSWGIHYDFFKKYFRVIDRKSLNKSVNEKFKETGDPIEDMGIGDPLHRAAAKIQEFAEENGYEFQMEKIGKTDSPVLYVPVTPRIEERSSFHGGGVVYITKIKYTITHMGHRGWNKTPFSLRKVLVGYAFVPSREDYILNHPRYNPQDEQFDSWLDWQKEELKRRLRGGGLKQRPLSQHLMGRFAEIHEIIDRITGNIKRETKK